MTRRILNALIRRLGYSPLPLGECLRALKGMGFHPKHIMDVGANHGEWTRRALRYFPEAEYTLLEPQDWLRRHVEDLLKSNPRVHWHGVGAGESPGMLKLTLAERDDSSSFRFTPEEAQALGRRQIEIPIVTIEQSVRETGRPIPDMIKIDAEGTDLAVLRGAGACLGVTELIFVEAGVMHKKIANDVLSVMQTMSGYGYRLFDVTDLNRTRCHGALWLVELAFVKVGGKLDEAVSSYD